MTSQQQVHIYLSDGWLTRESSTALTEPRRLLWSGSCVICHFCESRASTPTTCKPCLTFTLKRENTYKFLISPATELVSTIFSQWKRESIYNTTKIPGDFRRNTSKRPHISETLICKFEFIWSCPIFTLNWPHLRFEKPGNLII